MKAFSVKPRPDQTPRYRLSPMLTESILCGRASRITVPVPYAGPLPEQGTEAQVIERHLYGRSGQKRIVGFYPSKSVGLCVKQSRLDRAKSKDRPCAEGDPVELSDGPVGYAREMNARSPTDLRAWGTRLWVIAESARLTTVQDLTLEEMSESGARLRGLRVHPGQVEIRKKAYRSMWDQAWSGAGMSYEEDPGVVTVKVSLSKRAKPTCISPHLSEEERPRGTARPVG